MAYWPIEQGKAGFETLLGLSVAGLVIASVQSFAMVWPAAILPVVAEDFAHPANQIAWWIIETLFAPVFPILLAACFGAWLAALDLAPPPLGGRQWGLLGWLLPIGLFHAYLVWFGDLLVPFALAGLVVAAGARMRIASQLAIGGALVLFTVLVLLAGAAMGAIVGDSMSSAQALGFPPERIAGIEAVYRNGVLARLPANMGFALMHQLTQIVFLGGGIAGLMLIGMAALESGFLGLRWPPMAYALSGAVALGLGLPLCGWSNLHLMDAGFAPPAFGAAFAARMPGALLLAYGYAALTMLACQSGRMKQIADIVARLGRVWLSAYLLASLVLVLVFSGLPGLAAFGQVPRLGQLLIALGLVAALLAGAGFWTRRYRLGPVEWLWLVLVTRSRQSLRA